MSFEASRLQFTKARSLVVNTFVFYNNKKIYIIATDRLDSWTPSHRKYDTIML